MAVTFKLVNGPPNRNDARRRIWQQPEMAAELPELADYSDAMAANDPSGERDMTFANWLRAARIDAGWTKKNAIAAVFKVGVPERTYTHWESGTIAKPDPKQVRRACLRLGLDPREAAVALGIVTREDLDLGPELPPLPEAFRTGIALIRSDELTEAQKVALLRHVRASLELFAETMGVKLTDVKEPSADERTAGKPVKR